MFSTHSPLKYPLYPGLIEPLSRRHVFLTFKYSVHVMNRCKNSFFEYFSIFILKECPVRNVRKIMDHCISFSRPGHDGVDVYSSRDVHEPVLGMYHNRWLFARRSVQVRFYRTTRTRRAHVEDRGRRAEQTVVGRPQLAAGRFSADESASAQPVRHSPRPSGH